MKKLKNNTKDNIKEEKDGYTRYYDTIKKLDKFNDSDVYQPSRISIRAKKNLMEEEQDLRLSNLDIKVLSHCLEIPEDVYNVNDSASQATFNELIDCAISMYEGEEEFNKEWFMQFFKKLYNDEIIDILQHDGQNNLCNNRDFVLDLMEYSGAICEIACFASEDVIKQILEDYELLETICKKEALTSSNLDGDETLSVLLLQLNYFENLTKNKDFMVSVLQNMANLSQYTQDSSSFGIMMDILACNCEELLQERDFSEAIFNYIEQNKEDSKKNFWNLYDKADEMEKLAQKMLLDPELASDEDLARRYVKNFNVLYNVDDKFLKDKAFIEMILDECESFVLNNFELPVKFYSDDIMLDKYLRGKADVYDINGINFDFDNKSFTNLFERYYEESAEECMRANIANAIEKNKSIFICGKSDFDFTETVDVIQQWAEDEDLIKIGDKMKVISNPEDEIKEGQLNIVVGGNSKNNIIESDDQPTIVLDGSKIADTLKKIGIDTRINIDAIQKLYNELIENLKQRCEEEEIIMPRDVIDIVKKSSLIGDTENYINVKVDDESKKSKAIISIPHPVYRNEFSKVEIDGEELRNIIELANNNSLEKAKSKLDEITRKGIGDVSVKHNYAVSARFRGSEEDIVGVIGDEPNSAYVLGGKMLSSGVLSDLIVKMPYCAIYYNGIYNGGIGLHNRKIEMDEDQVAEFNHSKDELIFGTHNYRYGRVDGTYYKTVYDFNIGEEKYHIKEGNWTNGGRYTVIWKGEEANYPEVAVGISGSNSEWASSQCGVDEKGLIKFIQANPQRFSELFDRSAKRYDSCGVFPKMHLETLCSRIIEMLPESELRRKKEQDFIDIVQNLANKKSELIKKEQETKALYEGYVDLTGEKNKSVTDE